MFLTNYQSKGQTPHHMDLRKDKSAIEIQGKKQDLEAEVANLEDLRVAVNDQSSYAFNASWLNNNYYCSWVGGPSF